MAYIEDEMTVVEKVAKAVGFNATNELCARFGGRTFYVPTRPHDGHIISILLGQAKAIQLGEAIGGQTIELPMLRDVAKTRKEDVICRQIAAGANDKEILNAMDISVSQLSRLKKRNVDLIAAYVLLLDKQCGLFSSLKTKAS